MDARTQNPLALAFLGDAVYEIFVRERVLENTSLGGHADLLHKEAVKYVRAEAQAAAIKLLEAELTEEEAGVVRRAKNHKIATKPKNADPVTYKWATAFEALIGYLYLSERKDRAAELMKKAAEFTETK